MNICNIEFPNPIEAKIINMHKNRKKIAFFFSESLHNTVLTNHEIIIAQIQACQRLLSQIKHDTDDRHTIINEIVELELSLHVISNNKNTTSIDKQVHIPISTIV